MSKIVIPFSEAFKRAFISTYHAVGNDVEDSLAGERMSEKNRRACMVETILDANRMSMYGGADGKVADAECHQLIKDHGWPVVSKAAEGIIYG